MRAARERQEEALAMMQVQNTVTNMQQLDKIVQKSEKLVQSEPAAGRPCICAETVRQP